MTATHRHRAIASRTETRPFTGCVNHPCNPVAHGGVCLIEHCACGAWRAINSNAGQLETALWEPPQAHASPDADYTPITVGFDLRRHPDMAVQLPEGDTLRVRFMAGTVEQEVEGTRADVARRLRAAGYRVEGEVRP